MHPYFEYDIEAQVKQRVKERDELNKKQGKHRRPVPGRIVCLDWSGERLHVVDEDANGGENPVLLDYAEGEKMTRGGKKRARKDVKAFADVKDQFHTLDELFDFYEGQSIDFCMESTFESYEYGKKTLMMARAKRDGHRLFCTAPRMTRKHGESLEYTKADKSDYLDAYILRDMVLKGKAHLTEPKLYDPKDEFNIRRDHSRYRLMRLRRDTIVQSNGTRKSKKDILAEHLIAQLPNYSELGHFEPEGRTGILQVALGDLEEYSLTIIACVFTAAQDSNNNRDEWERILGIYSHGYPCIMRSDIYHHQWRFLREGYERAGVPGKRAGLITLTQFRWALRWLRWMIKDKEDYPWDDGLDSIQLTLDLY